MKKYHPQVVHGWLLNLRIQKVEQQLQETLKLLQGMKDETAELIEHLEVKPNKGGKR